MFLIRLDIFNGTYTVKSCHVILLIITMYLSLGVECVNGQNQLDTLIVDFDMITVDDGLSAGYTTEVAIDSSGFLWIATRQGLNRYDGYEIKEYRHIASDKYSLRYNKTNGLFIDSRNWLWIKLTPGLSLFDFYSESFIYFDMEAVQEIKEDKCHNLWIKEYGRDWKILSLDPSWKDSNDFSQLKSFIRLKEKNELFKGLPSHHSMNAILLSDKHGLLYHENDTLFAYDLNCQENSASLRFRKPLKSGLQNDKLYLFEDEDRNTLWFIDTESYYSIDPQNGSTLNSYRLPVYLHSDVGDIDCIYRNGNLYLTSKENKYYILSLFTGQVSILKKAGINDQREATLISGHDFEIDDHNNLWICTNGYGLYKFNLNKRKFKSFSPPYLKSIVGYMKSFRFTSGEEIFPPLISCLDNEDLELCLESRVYYKVKAKHNIIMTLVDLDVNVYLFLATNNTGLDSLLVFDKNGNQLQDFSFEHIGFKGKHHTSRLFFDSENVLCYIGHSSNSNELTLYRNFDLDIDSVKVHIYPRNNNDSFSGEVFMPYVANDGKIWIPTSSDGIYTWEPNTESWDHFKYDAENENSVSNNQVFSFLSDPTFPDSIMWVGTGDGLNKMNLKTNTFEVFRKKDGLPNSVIYGILSDDYNNLWLSTNYGICLFDPITNRSVHFNVEDGLLHNEFNKESHFKSENGILCFGGIGGINYFDPNVFYENYASSSIKITGVRINNEKIDFTRDAISRTEIIDLSRPIEYLEEITLNDKHKMITFKFALLDFTDPEENEYKYKLEGFNEKWINTKQSNEATFTNLPPGSYVFQVKGKNVNDTWSETPAKLKVIVKPPYWKTWWFRVIISSIIIAGVYLIYRNKKRQKEDLENLRNRISQDLHDEIGSTLSSISLFGVVAEKELERNRPLTKKMLRRIGTHTTSMMESLNDIVWAINSGNDKMIHVIQRMRSFTTELDGISGWNINFEYSSDIKEFEISMIFRRNIYLIFKEAVNNAIKYSQGHNLEIRIKNKGRNIRMEIIDDGQGFDRERIQHKMSMGGNGLINMERRADELGGQLTIVSNEHGTQVLLSFNINQVLKSI